MKKYSLTIVCSLILMFTSAVFAIPVVDGNLAPDTEYPSASEMQGNYSRTYSTYVIGDGFYIINDWYLPEVSFDPNNYCDPNDPECDPNTNDGCNGYNLFDWTDKSVSPYMYWRLKCNGSGKGEVFKTLQTDGVWHKVEIYNSSDPNYVAGFKTATGYAKTKNDRDNLHPIWEIEIPKTAISSNIEPGLVDPKFVPDECLTTQFSQMPWSALGSPSSPFGNAPFPNTGSGPNCD
jgi:hypothetical protein